MATRVQWLGHACLLIESDGKRVLIDPFLTGNPMAAAKAEEVEADVILVSHGHEDHLGDTVAIAQRTGATVVSVYELSNWLKGQGLTKLHGMQHGGGCQVDPDIHVKLTIAFHGSTLPGGGYGGNPCGFLITFRGRHPDLRRLRHRPLWRHDADRRRRPRPRHSSHRRLLHDGP